jgi:hypothetical protein
MITMACIFMIALFVGVCGFAVWCEKRDQEIKKNQ